jgi:hypothetical protein
MEDLEVERLECAVADLNPALREQGWYNSADPDIGSDTERRVEIMRAAMAHHLVEPGLTKIIASYIPEDNPWLRLQAHHVIDVAGALAASHYVVNGDRVLFRSRSLGIWKFCAGIVIDFTNYHGRYPLIRRDTDNITSYVDILELLVRHRRQPKSI